MSKSIKLNESFVMLALLKASFLR